MIVTEKNQQLFSRFLEQLESYGIEIGTKLDQMEKEKQDYDFFQSVQNLIESSKIDFCASYYELDEEERLDFQKKLLRLFKDQEIVDNIIQEIVNLYYLKETGMLDLEEVAPQKEIAFENLETLATKIDKFLQDTNIDQLDAEGARLSSEIDRLVDLGSILEGEVLTPIEDLDYLEEILELSSLSPEEKKQVIMDIIKYNIEVYKENLAERKAKGKPKPKKQDGPVEELEELEELQDNPKISPECLSRINELLSRKDVIQRIVQIVNDDFMMTINITSPTEEEKDLIDSSLDLAREEMIETLENDSNETPEHALNTFIANNDEVDAHKREILRILLQESEKSSLSKEDQKAIISMGIAYLDSHKKLLSSLSRTDKMRIHEYMKDLYDQPKNRSIIYEGKAHISTKEVEKEATYELQVMNELLGVVDENDEYYSKICKRMEEILKCVMEYTKKEPKKVLDEGNVFFLMKGDGESQLEADLGSEKKNRMIPSQYYGELQRQLEAIGNRGKRTLIAAQPVNTDYKYIRKEGVRYTTGSRTKVFFIPVGKKDSIVIGSSFVTGKDILKDQDMKVKRHFNQIETLKERLADPDAYREESKKSAEIRKRILLSLRSDELGEMFEEKTTSTIEKQATK